MIDCFTDVGRVGVYNNTRGSALILCMTSHFLFSTSSIALIDIYFDLGFGKNSIAMVLAETLNGLDDACAQGILLSAGSPLILQVWLQERLGLLIGSVPRPYHHRTVLFSGRSFADWILWMDQLSVGDICWIVNHWRIHVVTLKLDGFTRVLLMGLTKTSFYFPRRLARQYNHFQEASEPMFDHVCANRVRADTIAAFIVGWEHRLKAYY